MTLDFGDKEFDKETLETKLGILIWEQPEKSQIVRVKGIANIKGIDTIHSIQG